jgi:hypothetical protein
MKKLKMLVAIALTAVSCKEDMPIHHPSLVDLKENRVLKHDLIDKENLKYKADAWLPLSYVDGGYCFPKGELEKVLDYIRNNKCESH